MKQNTRQEKSLPNSIRQLPGTQDRHTREKIEKRKKMVEQEPNYFNQTLKR